MTWPPDQSTHSHYHQNTDAEMVNMAIQDTLNLSGWRIYGGHVYVAAGTVRFLNCHFWDSMILMPFTDVVAFGADVLVRL